MMKKKEKIVTSLTSGIEYLFKKNKVDYVKGWGSFKDKNTLSVKGTDGKDSEVSAKNFLIATGSEPTALPFLPFDEETFVSSTGKRTRISC
jgi:dihydrolipoamide dehydrogenase